MPQVPQINLRNEIAALYEGLKEFMRLLFAAVVPPVLILIQQNINIQTGVIAIPWELIRAVALFEGLTILIRVADRITHKYGQLKHPEKFNQSMGIIPW